MKHIHQARTSANPGNRAGQLCGCDEPGPFPVVIVRPATVKLAPYLRRHRRRQMAANRMAAVATEEGCEAARPWRGFDWGFGVNLANPRDYLTDTRDLLRAIMRDAPVLAQAPPPGAVRIGRDHRGGAVVVVLHAPAWSLVLRRARPYPAVWAFLGASNGYSLRLYGAGELSAQWYEMARDVYTVLTGDTC